MPRRLSACTAPAVVPRPVSDTVPRRTLTVLVSRLNLSWPAASVNCTVACCTVFPASAVKIRRGAAVPRPVAVTPALLPLAVTTCQVRSPESGLSAVPNLMPAPDIDSGTTTISALPSGSMASGRLRRTTSDDSANSGVRTVPSGGVLRTTPPPCSDTVSGSSSVMSARNSRWAPTLNPAVGSDSRREKCSAWASSTVSGTLRSVKVWGVVSLPAGHDTTRVRRPLPAAVLWPR